MTWIMHSVGYVFLAAEHCGTIVRLIQPSSCGVCLNFMTEPRSALGTGLIGDRRSKNHWTALQRNHNNPPPPPEEPFRRTVQRCTIVSVRVVSVLVTSLPRFVVPLGFYCSNNERACASSFICYEYISLARQSCGSLPPMSDTFSQHSE